MKCKKLFNFLIINVISNLNQVDAAESTKPQEPKMEEEQVCDSKNIDTILEDREDDNDDPKDVNELKIVTYLIL